MNNRKGFAQISLLIAIIAGILGVSSASYVGMKQYQTYQVKDHSNDITKQNTQSTTTPELSEVEKLRQEVEQLKKQQSLSSQSQSSVAKQEIVSSTPAKRVALSNVNIIKKVKPATVYIETVKGAGSGMIINTNGYILTNAHVVWDVSVAKIKLSDGKSLSAEVIGRDEIVDLAILKIVGSGFSKVTLGDSDNVVQGDDVFTLGYPFGLEGDVSFKEGTISRRISDGNATYLETSAEIHPGNSGGPLVNKYGEIVGINSASYGQSIKGVNIGETIKLAIPINVAKNLIPELKGGRKIVIDHTQYKSESESSSGGSDVVTNFAIKAQCQSLGQQRKDKEDGDYRDGSHVDGLAVAYGYSPNLNTCVYGRMYVMYASGENMERTTRIILWYVNIDDLMTGERIYGNNLWNKDLEADNSLGEKQKNDFWAVYNSLVP